MRKNAAIFLLLLLCAQAIAGQWTKQPSGTLAWLRDIYFTDRDHGWIVGSDGTILKTVDAGDQWAAIKKFTTDTILRVRFTDAANGWLLCERNVYSRGRNATSYLLHSTDGGETWNQIEFTQGGRERMTTLVFSSDGRGTAFGEGGVFYELQPDSTWKKRLSVVRHLLLAGAVNDDGNGAIVGGGGTALFTRDGGQSWDDGTVTGTQPTRLNAIFFTNPKLAWAVGSGGSIYTSVSGGKTWFPRASGTDKELTDICFRDTREGWASGDSGTILHTSDGGTAWTPEQTGITHRLDRIAFNADRGWAVGFGGTILRRSNTAEAASKPTLRKPI
jgi:photosystem II stability/assembly factor-like uncharacterized protein